MKNLIAVVIITVFCLIGSFFGLAIYVLITNLLYTGSLSPEILYTSEYTGKLVATLVATLVGAIGQEVIVPAQHKFTFWQFIRRNGMVKFAVQAGVFLAAISLIVGLIVLFFIEKSTITDFLVNNSSYRFTSILPAAFVFGACYGLGRWKSYELQFEQE